MPDKHHIGSIQNSYSLHTLCAAIEFHLYEDRQKVSQRKEVISFRLERSERKKIKELAERLSVRESDLLRYAIRAVVVQLAPLLERDIRGKDLLPVFVDHEAELLRYFDLDAARLDDIINSDCPEDMRIEAQDLSLLAMSGRDRRNARVWIKSMIAHEIKSHAPVAGGSDELLESLRHYFYQKYVFPDESDLAAGEQALVAAGENK